MSEETPSFDVSSVGRKKVASRVAVCKEYFSVRVDK